MKPGSLKAVRYRKKFDEIHSPNTISKRIGLLGLSENEYLYIKMRKLVITA